MNQNRAAFWPPGFANARVCGVLIVLKKSKRTILLADDSPTIQRLVTQTFEGSTFDIVSVSNGEAAVRKFDEVRPSAVLADIYMPGRNGYEVCSFVKEHPVLDQTPVILLVGAFEAYDEAEAERVGASGRITKPFEPQELLDLVSSMIPDDPVDALFQSGQVEDSGDLLGLETLFPPEPSGPKYGELSNEEIETIADRVIQKLSSEIIEGVAWDVVPEVAEKILREELSKQDEG